MRNRLRKDVCRALALVTALLILLGCAPVSAEDTVLETKALIDGILSYRLNAAGAAGVQDWLDHQAAESAAGEVWWALSLRACDETLDFSAYADALEETVRDHAPSGASARLTAVNLAAPQKLTRLMAGRETGRGAVVNILDTRILGVAREGLDAYAATKAALLDDTRKAAALFAETLRVNAVAPGPVLPPTAVHEKAGETLIGRPTADDVAACVAYLLTARATTGAVIPVDGGQHLLGGLR